MFPALGSKISAGQPVNLWDFCTGGSSYRPKGTPKAPGAKPIPTQNLPPGFFGVFFFLNKKQNKQTNKHQFFLSPAPKGSSESQRQ